MIVLVRIKNNSASTCESIHVIQQNRMNCILFTTRILQIPMIERAGLKLSAGFHNIFFFAY